MPSFHGVLYTTAVGAALHIISMNNTHLQAFTCFPSNYRVSVACQRYRNGGKICVNRSITDDAAACFAAADEDDDKDVADATLLIDTLKSNATRKKIKKK